MATKGTPDEGQDNVIGARVYTTGTLQLRCYINTADSLSESTVFADMTEPTGTGYGFILLNGVYSFNNGVITYDHGTPDDPIFENTESEGGSNWSNPITGVWMTDGTYVLHFQDLVTSVTMTPGKKLQVDLSTLIAP